MSAHLILSGWQLLQLPQLSFWSSLKRNRRSMSAPAISNKQHERHSMSSADKNTTHKEKPVNAMRIPLTKGKYAIVDADDFERVNQYKWYYAEKTKGSIIGYAKKAFKSNGRAWCIRMHRFILNAPVNFQVDHIDGNSLNNQKSNLRLCTLQQNCFNKKFESGRNSTGFKGVSSHSNSDKWRARVKLNRREIHLGLFNSKEDAARAYDAKAIEVFGVFAKTNEALGRFSCST